MKAQRNPFKPRVASDYEGWAVLLDGRWRVCGTWQSAMDVALARCDEHGPPCGQKGCPCRIPGPVCSFRGRLLDDCQWCPRCGWSRRLHEEGPVDDHADSDTVPARLKTLTELRERPRPNPQENPR